jgi:hypothetical protein
MVRSFQSRVCSSRTRVRVVAIGVLLVSASCLACSTQQVRHSEAFWRQAIGDATVRVVPPRDVGAPGVTTQDEFRGAVVRHERASGSAVDHVLELKRAGGDIVKIYYRIGGNRVLPLATGDHGVIRVLHRRHVEDDGVDVGLLAWRLGLTVGAAGTAAPTSTESKELVAVVEMREVLDPKTVPALLKSLRATDIAAYHESGTYVGNCEEIRAHHHFRIMRPKWVVTEATKPLESRLLGPGSMVVLDDGSDRFEVLLLDNRKTEASTCIVAPEPTWSWAAVRVKRADDQMTTQIDDPNNKPGDATIKSAPSVPTR